MTEPVRDVESNGEPRPNENGSDYCTLRGKNRKRKLSKMCGLTMSI